MTGPDPETLHPLPEHPRVVFLRPLARGRANVEVGEFAYYDDPDDATGFFERNVLHHHDFMGDRLFIGRFTAIATGARLVMNGANHDMSGFTTFPFDIFAGWGEFEAAKYLEQSRGDMTIGPDVWIGSEAWIMPGISIGAGAIVAAKAVVGRDVPPYAIVAGNPARVVRHRFDPDTTRRLLAVAWWDWPLDRITRNLATVRGTDIAALEAAA
ncbi:CatB-related O-acetyltransferase [Roseitranquillus sediminis]|uniref:CatB-related O-acetyltransferase n=1 Tax=Roseitranquillus sediminis TaxID=2809051 RepID=UPI001D0C5532|nr:CatB-related O-acetyltransferase [Roseitranquillus sediminis]MBM9596432.1 CatB-related O-acetyltransferase [Roseitranquillus sediminis]